MYPFKSNQQQTPNEEPLVESGHEATSRVMIPTPFINLPAASGGVAEEDIAPAIKQHQPASRLFEEEESKDVTQQALIPDQPSD